MNTSPNDKWNDISKRHVKEHLQTTITENIWQKQSKYAINFSDFLPNKIHGSYLWPIIAVSRNVYEKKKTREKGT